MMGRAHPEFFLGPRSPPAFQRSLTEALLSQKNVSDVVSLVKPLQVAANCSVCLGTVQGELCVVKTYNKHAMDLAELQQAHLEVQLHQQLDSDFVVPFWDAVNEGAELHIITAYCQQSDVRSLLTSGPLSEPCMRNQVVLPLLRALCELHVKGYVHRDIKPDNVFLAGSSALLGDFSLAVGPLPGTPTSAPRSSCQPDTPPAATSSPFSRCSSDSSTCLTPSSSDSLLLHESESGTHSAGDSSESCELGWAGSAATSLSSSRSSSRSSSSFNVSTLQACCHAGGTPAYCAPEVVLAAFNSITMAEALGPQNDIWSLGILVLECLMGSHPYGREAAASGAVMHTIIGSQPLPLSTLQVSAQCKDWLAAALAKDPRQRWSAERLLQHAWITDGQPAAAGGTQEVGGTTAAAAGPGSSAAAATMDAKQQQQQCAWGYVPPPWVEDDWVSGLDRLSSQLEAKAAGSSDVTCLATQCRQQEQQQVVLQQCRFSGITSWED